MNIENVSVLDGRDYTFGTHNVVVLGVCEHVKCIARRYVRCISMRWI